MRVRTTPGAADLIVRSGGRLFVWATDHRCCGGRLTTLEVATEPPASRRRAADVFRLIAAEDFTLFVATGARTPDELVLEAKGRRRPRIRAYWDGCVYAP
jgi:hypothetical protein